MRSEEQSKLENELSELKRQLLEKDEEIQK